MSKIGQILFFLGLVFLVLWFISMRVVMGSAMPFMWILLGIGAACVLGAVFKDIGFFVDLAGQRTTRHGLNLGVLVVIVLAILVGVNFIGFRHVKKFDFTKEGLHSLSDQTLNILKSLDADMEIKAFFVEGQDRAGDKQKFKDLVDLYSSKSSKLKISFIDPMRRPDEAKANEVTTSGVVLLNYKGKSGKFEDFTEQGFTNAIIKITRSKNKVVYFLTGHGEIDVENSEATGGQQFKKYLTDASYETKVLSFIEKAQVPEDASVIVVMGPKQSLLDPEVQVLKNYLYGGGKLLLALDPGTKQNMGAFVKSLGLEFKDNYILDPLGQMAGASAAMALGITYSPTSDITKGFAKNNMTLFHLASQVKPLATKPDGFIIDEVVKSSPASFSKADLKPPFKPAEGKDEKGSLTIMASVTGKFKDETGKPPAQEFQAVVVGDSDFLTNQLVDAQLNHDLALNTLSFLAKDKELVSIRPKQSEGSQVTMTQMQLKILFYGFVFVVPLLMILVGGAFWVRRRTA